LANTELRVLNGGVSAVWADVTCSTVVPVSATSIGFDGQVAGVAMAIFNLGCKGTVGTNGTVTEELGTSKDYGSFPSVPCNSSQVISYKTNAGNLTLWVREYAFER
jgi:hypothetical protein